VKPVGYHAWADDHTLALFVLGQPATLQIADTRTGTARVIARDIGRSIQRIPGSTPVSSISFVQRERSGDTATFVIKELDPATGATTVLIPAVAGSTEADCAWTPDGTLLMVKGGVLYSWKRGQSGMDGSRDARTAQLGRGHAPCCQPERGLSGARRSSSAEPLIYCREGPR
jgi:hypothetical protein